MENTLNLRVLRGLLPLAAKKDIRTYLTGVYVDFQADKTIYVAADRHVLGVYTESSENENVFSVIVPGDVVKQVKLAKYANLFYGSLVFTPGTGDDRILNPGSGRILNPANDQDLGFKPVAEVYPDYKRVIPADTTGEVGQFNVELLNAFMQVNKALGSGCPGYIKIDHNGPVAPALVHLSDDNFLGVLAPVCI